MLQRIQAGNNREAATGKGQRFRVALNEPGIVSQAAFDDMLAGRAQRLVRGIDAYDSRSTPHQIFTNQAAAAAYIQPFLLFDCSPAENPVDARLDIIAALLIDAEEQTMVIPPVIRGKDGRLRVLLCLL